MGAAYSISDHAAGATLILLASVNMVVFISLLGEASSSYLHRETINNKPEVNAYAMRLQLFRLIVGVVSVAAGIKLTLNAKLANDLIAAWFVGQGFALQQPIRNIICGIIARYNPNVANMLQRSVTYQDKQYKVVNMNISSITLLGVSELNTVKAPFIRIVPWTAVDNMELQC